MNIQKVERLTGLHTSLLLLAGQEEALIFDYLVKGVCFSLDNSEGLAGMIVLLPVSSNLIEVVNIVVSPEHQGKGYAKNLVEHAIAYSRQEGFVSLEIGVSNCSMGSLFFCQKCGFRMIGVEKDHYDHFYSGKKYENGILCVDMLRMGIVL